MTLENITIFTRALNTSHSGRPAAGIGYIMYFGYGVDFNMNNISINMTDSGSMQYFAIT